MFPCLCFKPERSPLVFGDFDKILKKYVPWIEASPSKPFVAGNDIVRRREAGRRAIFLVSPPDMP